MVSFKEFKDLKFKVGIIKTVENIEGADKLYKLTVDIGEERTLVAGVAEQYSKEELVGKQIMVLTNLDPATNRGVKSEGMLLAAVDGDKISIVMPDKEMKPGSSVE